MKVLSKYSMISALLVLLTFSMGSQAQVVDSGFKVGSWADSGNITLAAGDYTLELLAVAFSDPAGPFVFGLKGASEPLYKVTLATEGFVSQVFSLAGGTYHWLVGGNGGDFGTGFTASVNAAPVPLPSSVIMIGSALAAMVSIGRRGASRRARA
ncbi:MAG: hypothetical protein IPM80_02405 [Proteobacteria bacterium]|jgi:hypothetical protein|nr:hypothetical protein [Pseudomonadota bacterium]